MGRIAGEEREEGHVKSPSQDRALEPRGAQKLHGANADRGRAWLVGGLLAALHQQAFDAVPRESDRGRETGRAATDYEDGDGCGGAFA